MITNLSFIYLLADVPGNAESPTYYMSLIGIIVVGFVAATGIGSIAWYNSKRPVGWEDKERPDVVPKVEKSQNPGV